MTSSNNIIYLESVLKTMGDAPLVNLNRQIIMVSILVQGLTKEKLCSFIMKNECVFTAHSGEVSICWYQQEDDEEYQRRLNDERAWLSIYNREIAIINKNINDARLAQEQQCFDDPEYREYILLQTKLKERGFKLD